MPFTSDQFTYNAASRTLVACASDLGLEPGRFPRMLEIRHRGVATFMAIEAEKTAEGELLGVRYHQTAGPCIALILND